MIFIKPLFTLLFVRQVKLVMQVNLFLLLSFTVMLRVSGFLRPLVYARSQNQRLMSTIGRNSASDMEPDLGEGGIKLFKEGVWVEDVYSSGRSDVDNVENRVGSWLGGELVWLSRFPLLYTWKGEKDEDGE